MTEQSKGAVTAVTVTSDLCSKLFSVRSSFLHRSIVTAKQSEPEVGEFTYALYVGCFCACFRACVCTQSKATAVTQ